MSFTNPNWWKRTAAMVALAAASLLVMTATSFAQGHSQSHERRDLKDHQRQERYYNGNSYATRDHQRAERDQLKHEQRAERRGGYYNNGYYNNGGYYGNSHSNNGYYNDGYYNNGHGNGSYNNGGYYNGSYYGGHGNSSYYTRRPHYDSGSFGNRLHHAFGGH
jgi:hypothetical protein